MNSKYFIRIQSELVKHGATENQAKAYCDLITLYERSSKDDRSIERHHILPVNCGWWKEYKKAKWNIVKVRWGLHIALHAFLHDMFPKNLSLIKGLQQTVRHRRGEYENKLKNKKRVIKWYEAEKSCLWISKKVKVSATCIRSWLVSWDIKIHPLGWSSKKEHKQEMAELYHAGNTLKYVADSFDVSEETLRKWFTEWGFKRRVTSTRVDKEKVKSNIIKQYEAGTALKRLESSFRVAVPTLCSWFKEWGIRVRSRSEAARMKRRGGE